MKVIINAYFICIVSCEKIVKPFFPANYFLRHVVHYCKIFLSLMFSFAVLGLGLGDILKPDLIMPLIETLPLEEGLLSHLPEVYDSLMFGIFLNVLCWCIVIMRLQGHWTPEDILDLLQSPPFRQQVDSFTYVRNARRPIILVLFLFLFLFMIAYFTRSNTFLLV